jgi:hypothetical protein
MKKFMIIAILLWGSGSCLAQDSKQEIQGVYLRIQTFTFNSGYSEFNIQQAAINGGGYAFIFHITDKFGLFQQMGFYGGPEQNGLKLRLITEFQGMIVTKKAGPLDLYAKGGLGFTRYVFTGNAVYGKFAVLYGGGAEIKMKEGLNLVLEASRLTMGLPQLSISPDRSKWSNSWQLSTGIAIHF